MGEVSSAIAFAQFPVGSLGRGLGLNKPRVPMRGDAAVVTTSDSSMGTGEDQGVGRKAVGGWGAKGVSVGVGGKGGGLG